MTHKPTNRSNTHALWRIGGKYAAAATATTIPAPNTRGKGDNYPCTMMMGHGFNNFRDINYINPAVVPILKACFQMGVEKESNIKGVLEMEEECEKKLPSLLFSDRHAIKAWLSAWTE